LTPFSDKVGPNEGQQFYEKEFEARYIDRLKQFYAGESTAFLLANGVSLFLQKVNFNSNLFFKKGNRPKKELTKKNKMLNIWEHIFLLLIQRSKRLLMKFLLRNIWNKYKLIS
jgi:hypothetical protein